MIGKLIIWTLKLTDDATLAAQGNQSAAAVVQNREV